MKKIWIVLASIGLLWGLNWCYHDVPDDDTYYVRRGEASGGQWWALMEMDSPFYIEFVRKRVTEHAEPSHVPAGTPSAPGAAPPESLGWIRLGPPITVLESKTIARIESRFNFFSGNYELLFQAHQSDEAVVVSCNVEQFTVKMPSARVVGYPSAGRRMGERVGIYFIKGAQSANTYEQVMYIVRKRR